MPQTPLVDTHAYACVNVLLHATIIWLPSCSPPTQNPVRNPATSYGGDYSAISGSLILTKLKLFFFLLEPGVLFLCCCSSCCYSLCCALLSCFLFNNTVFAVWGVYQNTYYCFLLVSKFSFFVASCTWESTYYRPKVLLCNPFS